MTEFVERIGTFLLLVGAFLFILFYASNYQGTADFDYFFMGVVFCMAGWMMRRKKSPPAPAGRFSYFKKVREDAAKKREERIKAEKEKKEKQSKDKGKK